MYIFIQILILVSLFFFIKKFSISKTPFGLLIIYLLILYDNTIITGTIFSNNPVFIIQSSLIIYVLIYSLSSKIIINKSLFSISAFSLTIIFFYFLLFLIEILRLIIFGFETTGLNVVLTELIAKIMFILLFIFLLTTNKIHNNYKYMNIIIKPYFYISLSIIFSSILILLLASIGIVDLYNWTNIPEYIDPQIHTRRNEFIEAFGISYHGAFSFPFNISLFWIYDFLGTFQGLLGVGGRAMGLSKEPHIACLFLTPSLFLVKYFIKENLKKIIYLFYFLFFISALSMSNIFGLVFVFIVYQAKLLIRSEGISKNSIIFGILFFSGVSAFVYFNYDIIQFILKRFTEFNVVGSSGETVLLRFQKLFLPETFLGSGFLFNSNKIVTEIRDYGFLPMVVFFTQYLLILYLSIKIYFSNYKYKQFGLSTIYILIHGIKVYGDLPINYFYLFLILSLIFINEHKEINFNKHLK